MVAAICASVSVLVGLARAIPGVLSVLRGGGWPDFRRRVVTAALLTGLAIAAMLGLSVWAHRLTADERAGRDGAYAVTFVIVACLVVACLIAWDARGGRDLAATVAVTANAEDGDVYRVCGDRPDGSHGGLDRRLVGGDRCCSAVVLGRWRRRGQPAHQSQRNS